jgi:hypothetical protein
MSISKRNLPLRLAQTKLPKAAYDHVSFASQIFNSPPPQHTRPWPWWLLQPHPANRSPRRRARSGPKMRVVHPRSGCASSLADLGSPSTGACRQAPSSNPSTLADPKRRAGVTGEPLLRADDQVRQPRQVSIPQINTSSPTTKSNLVTSVLCLMAALYGKAAPDPDTTRTSRPPRTQRQGARHGVASPIAKVLV